MERQAEFSGSGEFPNYPVNDLYIIKILPSISFDERQEFKLTNTGPGYYCLPFPYIDVTTCDSVRATSPLRCPGADVVSIVIIFFSLLALSIFIALGNAAIVFVIALNKSFYNPHNMIKMSLAIADLIVGVFSLPVAVVQMALVLFRPFEERDDELLIIDIEQGHERNLTIVKKLVGDSVCLRILNMENVFTFFVSITSLMTGMASIYHLFLLSFDRFLAVKSPMKYKKGSLMTNKRAGIMIGLVWCICIGAGIIFPLAARRAINHGFVGNFISSLKMVYVTMGVIYTTIGFILPYLLTFVLTLATSCVLLHRWYIKKTNQTECRIIGQGLRMKIEVRATITLIIMILAFTITTFPSLISLSTFLSQMQNNVYKEDVTTQIVAIIMVTFLISNSACNFIIYSFRSKDFRVALRKLLRKTCRWIQDFIMVNFTHNQNKQKRKRRQKRAEIANKNANIEV